MNSRQTSKLFWIFSRFCLQEVSVSRVPVVVAALRAFLRSSTLLMMSFQDLSTAVNSLASPGNVLNARYKKRLGNGLKLSNIPFNYIYVKIVVFTFQNWILKLYHFKFNGVILFSLFLGSLKSCLSQYNFSIILKHVMSEL